MVPLTPDFSKLCSKMEDHHQPHPEPDSIFEAFQGEALGSLDRLVPSSNPDLHFPSLCWAKQCLGVLQPMTETFTKIAARTDHPVSRWEADIVESYLSYSLNMLELFNSISSCLSHLGQSRLSLSYALTFLEDSPPSAADRLAPIHPQQVQVKELGSNIGTTSSPGKEPVIHRGLRLMEGVGYWVCGIALSALSGDPKPYLETRRWAIGPKNSRLTDLDRGVHEVILQKGIVPREVEEINESVSSLVAAIQQGSAVAAIQQGSAVAEAEDLGCKLEGFKKLIDEINGGVDCLFSEILRSRNEVIDCLRIPKH